jgi:hypothetical protein
MNAVALFSVFTQPFFGIPATDPGPSTIFSIADVSYEIFESGSVVVVVAAGDDESEPESRWSVPFADGTVVVVGTDVVVVVAAGIVVVVVVVVVVVTTTGGKVDGADADVESMTMDRGAPGEDVLPAASATVAVTDHVPSVNAGRLHDESVVASYEHETIEPPFCADTVTVSAVDAPTTLMVGVVSAVTLSVDDAPVSEAGSRSGAEGADGTVVSITTVTAGDTDDTLFRASVRTDVRVHDPSERFGNVQDSTPGATT